MKRAKRHGMEDEASKKVEHILRLIADLRSSLTSYQDKVRRMLLSEMMERGEI